MVTDETRRLTLHAVVELTTVQFVLEFPSSTRVKLILGKPGKQYVKADIQKYSISTNGLTVHGEVNRCISGLLSISRIDSRGSTDIESSICLGNVVYLQHTINDQ